jgi:hypothetical protein
MKTYGAALFAFIAGAASAVEADESIAIRPSSCLALATVQLNDCSVLNVFRCGDGATAFFRYEGHDADGPDLVNHMNLSYGLMQAAEGTGDEVYISRLKGGVAEAPLDQIFSDGSAPFSYQADLSIFGISKPISTQGVHRALPGQVRVSGHALKRIRADISMELPAPAGTIEGWYMIYVSDALGLVFEGEGEISIDGNTDDLPSSPASIALPEEAGFGTTIPDSGCGEISLAPNPSNHMTRG